MQQPLHHHPQGRGGGGRRMNGRGGPPPPSLHHTGRGRGFAPPLTGNFAGSSWNNGRVQHPQGRGRGMAPGGRGGGLSPPMRGGPMHHANRGRMGGRGRGGPQLHPHHHPHGRGPPHGSGRGGPLPRGGLPTSIPPPPPGMGPPGGVPPPPPGTPHMLNQPPPQHRPPPPPVLGRFPNTRIPPPPTAPAPPTATHLMPPPGLRQPPQQQQQQPPPVQQPPVAMQIPNSQHLHRPPPANNAIQQSNMHLPQQRLPILHQQPPPRQQQSHAPVHYTNIPGAAVAAAAAQPATSSTATTTTTTATQQQIDSAWSEHSAPNGMKFFHNSITKKSTYTKPACLLQKANPTGAGAATTTTTTSRPWVEYKDATTGKVYYSDGVSSSWEKPPGFQSTSSSSTTTTTTTNTHSNGTIRSQEQQLASSSTIKTLSPSQPPKKKKKLKKETPFTSNEEAIAAFKGLLLAKGVSPTLKWNEVVKLISSDARWDDCENALTTGERKQALAEYQTKRANELRTLERQERVRAKDAFSQLLSEVLPTHATFSILRGNSSRWTDIRDSISKDDRFYAVQDEETRESLFVEFCEGLRKLEERKKRSKKREVHDAFLSFLREKEEKGILTCASTWNNFISSLDDADRNDLRFQISPSMSDSDRDVYFADFMIDLQRAEDDKRWRIRDARRRAEKAQRDTYRDALHRLAAEGKVMPSSWWSEVESTVSVDRSFGPVQEQDRDAPREIFEGFVDDWNDMYRRERSFLSQLVHPSSNREIIVKVDTTYDEFVKALMEEAASSQLYGETKLITNRQKPVSSARLYYNEMLHKAKEAGKRRRRESSSSEDEGEILEDGELKDDDDNGEGPKVIADENQRGTQDGETTPTGRSVADTT